MSKGRVTTNPEEEIRLLERRLQTSQDMVSARRLYNLFERYERSFNGATVSQWIANLIEGKELSRSFHMLKEIGAPAVPPLVDLLLDEPIEISALTALEEICESCPLGLSGLANCMTSKDHTVRDLTIDLLLEFRAFSEIETLLSYLKIETSNEVKKHLEEAISLLIKASSS